ncbi:copper amine oxidase N-terminal domain-containing protein [Paenibacillus sp.]|uniref:copper amine oxidase N-terminal domain-containing protein n=1 Tax=Paenibacillus sp. TaxID=58172 RepID=UPI002D63FD02|nr:copper amine oxidase N-terminal domain-containing protein [Paenibacillus sp.]HZG55332.1 copper amine oxidase N-terminal domain-containing protein [Paenibacillus sp.]
MARKAWTRIAIACALAAAPLASPFGHGGGGAAAAEQPIRIVFDGETLALDAAPFIRNGTTFVPFRALFERLGLTVGWDAATKTATGTGSVNVSLRVGSVTATVDGETKTLLEPPAVAGGRTFVPLRFVSENAGATVGWDQASRTVTVTTGPSIAEQEAAARAAYEGYVAASNREDARAALRWVHPESPLRTALNAAMADAFARRDVETTIDSLVVDAVQGGVATLYVTESNVRTSGAYYVDNRVDVKATMRTTAAGAWALYDVDVLAQEWLSPFGAAAPDAAISPEDEEAARNTIAAYMEALNQEDLQGALTVVHPDSPMRASTESTLRWMFDAYALSHELETVRVLDRTADELYVYTVQALRKSAGPKLADVRTESIHTLRRLPNGQWRLYSTVQGETETLSIPQ